MPGVSPAPSLPGSVPLATLGQIIDTVQTVAKVAETATSVSNLVSKARGLVDSVVGETTSRLEIPDYFFCVNDGPDPGWHVRHVVWTEALSECYELVVDVLTDQLDVETDGLIGASANLDLERADLRRSVYGIITRVDYLGVEVDHLHVRVYLVPALRLFAQRVDTRIFQDQTVPEILELVLKAPLMELGRKCVTRFARDDYPKRDYCVQYRESDLEFASRLMQEEGITFFFEPDDQARAETLILIDNGDDFPDVSVLYDEPVPIVVDSPDSVPVESLRNLDWIQPEQSSRVVVRGFNWKDPTTELEGIAEDPRPIRERIREVYLHGERRKIVDAADDAMFDGTAIEEQEPEALRRMQAIARSGRRGHGRSNVTGFSPGSVFTLDDHGIDSLSEQRFLLTRVVHTGDCPDQGKQNDPDATRYENRFECVPAGMPFRPAPVLRRPRVFGPETAIVTGPPNEEIHVDQHGRIKIRFHWDRISPFDDSASCWVRVAQMFAGPGWGTVFIPRVGMEVIVEFLDGNPDRPIVTGCVYNGHNSLPYTLPDEKTKTVIKTSSSPGGNGYNELTFDDLAGAEKFIVHAQKDLTSTVENDRTRLVGRNEAVSVKGNRTVSVTGDQTTTITGKQSITVKGGRSSLDVTGHCVTTASDTAFLSAPNKITFQCQGSFITLEPTKITIHAGDNAELVLDAEALMQAAGGASAKLNAEVEIAAKKEGRIHIDDYVFVESSSGGTLEVYADIIAHAEKGGTIVCDANVDAGGEKVTLHTKTATAELAGGVTISAPNVSVTGTAKIELSTPALVTSGNTSCTISGGVVKIN